MTPMTPEQVQAIFAETPAQTVSRYLNKEVPLHEPSLCPMWLFSAWGLHGAYAPLANLSQVKFLPFHTRSYLVDGDWQEYSHCFGVSTTCASGQVPGHRIVVYEPDDSAFPASAVIIPKYTTLVTSDIEDLDALKCPHYSQVSPYSEDVQHRYLTD